MNIVVTIRVLLPTLLLLPFGRRLPAQEYFLDFPGSAAGMNASIARDGSWSEYGISVGYRTSTGQDRVGGIILHETFPTIDTLHYDAAGRAPSLAFHVGSGRFALAHEREDGRAIRIAILERYQTRPGGRAIATLDVTVPGGTAHRHPAISGTVRSSSDDMLLVFEVEVLAKRSLFGVRIDPTGQGAASAPFQIGSSRLDDDLRHPSIAGTSDADGDHWLVVWQQRDRSGRGQFEVQGAFVANDGTVSASRLLATHPDPDVHHVVPKIAGRDGRHTIAYLARRGMGDPDDDVEGLSLYARRLDWMAGGSPTVFPAKLLASRPWPELELGTGRPIAFDHDGRSHWMVAWIDRSTTSGVAPNAFAVRLGFSGSVVESFSLPSSQSPQTSNPGLLYTGGTFVCSYTSFRPHATLPNTIQSQLASSYLQYANARDVLYGSFCGSWIEGANTTLAPRPYAGSEFYGVRITNGLRNAPAALYLALAPASLPLGACEVSLDLAQSFPLSVSTTDGQGEATTSIPLPDDPLFTGTLYFQYVQLDAPSQTVKTTPGLRVEVR